MKELIIGILMALCITTQVQAINIVLNPGFEDTVNNDWYRWGAGVHGEVWNITNADAHSGQYSATNVGHGEAAIQWVTAATNDISDFSFWLRQPYQTYGAFTVYFWYEEGDYSCKSLSLSSNSWEHVDVLQYLSPDRTLSIFGISGYSSGDRGEDRTYLDDVFIGLGIKQSPVVVSVPEPETALLLGFVLLILALATRKIEGR